MSSPLRSAEREFDLSHLLQLERKVRKQTFALALVLAVVFVAIGAVVLVLSILQGFTPNAAVFAAFMWALPIVFAYATLRRPVFGLVKFGLGDGIIHLYYVNGQEQILDMASPTFGLTLDDHSIDTGAIGSAKEEIRLRVPDQRDTTVNREILEAIVRMANEKGVPVLVRQERHGGGKVIHDVIATRIGRPENTPGWAEARVIVPD